MAASLPFPPLRISAVLVGGPPVAPHVVPPVAVSVGSPAPVRASF